MRVRAKNVDAQNGPWSEVVTGTTDDVPDAPARPTSGRVTHNSLEVNWTAPPNNGSGINLYGVQYRQGTSGSWTSWSHSGTARTATITGLQKGTSYQVQVRARNAVGWSDWSPARTFTTDNVPDRPNAPTFGATTGRTAVVNWTAPRANGDTVRNYDIRYRWVSDGSWTNGPQRLNATTTTITGLTRGRTYSVQVRARNNAGASLWSTSGTVTTGDNDAPVFSGDAALTATENDRLAGTVQASDPDGEDSVAFRITGGADGNRFSIDSAGVLRFNAAPDFERPRGQPVSAGNTNTYALTIAADGGSGGRRRTTERDYQVTVEDAQETPGRPAPPTRAAAAATSLTLAWTAPANTGPPVTDYDVRYRVGSSGSFTDARHTGAATAATLTGLDPDTDHQVQVRASSAEDTGDWSNPATLRTGARAAVSGVTVRAPAVGGTFVRGEEVAVEVTFDRAVTVSGAPVLALAVGAEERVARYTRFTAPALVVFTYTVGEGDSDPDGLSVPADALRLPPGASIRDAAGDDVEPDLDAHAIADAPDLTVDGRPNAPPVFSGAAAFEVAENTTDAGTVTAADPDAGDRVTGFRLLGADADRFEISDAGALAFLVAPDFENPRGRPAGAANTNIYRLRVVAMGGEGAYELNSERAYTVTVTDALEPPPAPDAPTAGETTETGIVINWRAPDNPGRPPVTRYDVQYRARGGSPFETADHDGAATTVRIAGLLPGTTYEVQVRARNDEGASPWSELGAATTVANARPVFSGGATFIVAENSIEAGAVQAADPDAADEVTGFTLGGADAGLFEISDTGALAFLAAPDFERPRGAPVSPANANAYALTVIATGGSEARALEAARDYTVTVTDVREPPGRAAAPTFGVVTATSLAVNWTAPANAGPAPLRYDLQYREAGTAGSFTAGPQDAVGLSATLAGLATGTEYEVRVRAENAEGAGAWSEPATAETVVNAPPSLSLPGTGSLPVDVEENVRRVRVVVATDPDAGDPVTGYTLAGPDADLFEFRDESGSNTLFFRSAPDFEDPQGGAANDSNTYEVTVTATGGAGARALSVERQLVVTVTDAPEPPAFEGPATLEVAENGTDAGTVTAADPDAGDAVTGYTLGGADADLFAIGADGALAFLVAPDFERPLGGTADDSNDYAVTVTATGGADGMTAARDYTVRVTDVREPPGRPAAPRVVRTAAESIELAWQPPGNTGPPIRVYDLQYREAGTGADWIAGPQGVTGTGATIASLAQGTRYEAQVRARNVEGAGDWSAAAAATTVANAPPAFGSGVPASGGGFAAPENRVAVAAVTATDPDAGDDVTYRLTGADAGLFEIADVVGVPWLRFVSAPDFEDPQGGAANDSNTYEVTVTATGGTGTRALSAVRAWTVTVTNENEPPVFSGDAAFEVAENATEAGAVQAADPDAGDSVTAYRIAGGADAGLFGISNAGALRFVDAPDFENPRGGAADDSNTYEVRVAATGGVGALTATRDYTVTVTDEDEPPAAPTAPSFADIALDGFTVNWTAPANAGPPIEGYDLQYRETGTGADFADGPQDVTGTSAALAGLAPGTEHEVRVRAENAEGPGAWSDAGTVITVANRPPAWDEPFLYQEAQTRLTFTADENVGQCGLIGATDPDDGDEVTYAVTGTDGHLFSIGPFATLPHCILFPHEGGTADFEDRRDANRDNVYEFTVTATGGTAACALSIALEVTATVENVPEPPVFSGPETFEVPENNRQVGTVQASDPDAGETVAYALGGADASLFEITDAGALSFLEAPDFETPLGGANDDSNSYALRVTVTSGAGSREMSASRDYTVRVTGVREPPSAPAAPTVLRTAGDSVLVEWQAPANAGPPIADYVIVAALPGETAPQARLVAPAPGAETRATLTGLTPGIAYRVRVRARSAEGESAWSDWVDAPVAANNPPVFTGPSDFQAIENALTHRRGNIEVSDPDPGDRVRRADMRLSGPDAGLFDLALVGSGTGLVFKTRPDFERPRGGASDDSNTYEVTVTATGGAGARAMSASRDYTVTVTDEDEPPRFTGPAAFDMAENGTAAGTVAAIPDGGNGVAFEVLGGADADLFEIAADGALSFKTPPDFERPQGGAANDSNIYEVTVRIRTTNTFVDSARAPKDRAYRVTVTDVDTEAPGAPAPEVSSVTETGFEVTWAAPANAGPPIEGYEVQYRRGYAGAFADAGHAGTGTSQRIDDLEPGAAYQVQVRARNAEGTGPWSAPVTTITTANDAPAFAAGTVDPVHAAEVAENAVQVVEVTASDPDDPVTYGLTGPDANWFEVVESGAAQWLAFKAAPDFESPGSAANSNTYAVTVTVTGGAGVRAQSVSADVTVTVTDAPEPPAFSGPETLSVAENTTDAGTVQAADPDAGERVTGYTLGGADAARFGITDAGALSFVSAPDFERPGSAAGTNAYAVTVTATSGTDGMTASRDLTVTVTDALEPPGVPAAPAFGTATGTSLAVRWTAPANAGPPIEGYDLQYRQAGTGADFTDGPQDVAETRATVAGLTGGADYEVRVRAENDEGPGAWSAAATARVAANALPAFTLGLAPSFDARARENGARVVEVTASDRDSADAVTGYALGGADRNLFEIVQEGDARWLAFRTAPDFERPRGAPAGATNPNVYEVTVTATGGDGARARSVTAAGRVTVTDADEAPVFSGDATFEVAENATEAGTVQAADPDAGDSLTGYRIASGADAALFDIAADGVLSFKSPPDFENPGSAASTNVFEVTVEATGGASGLTAERGYRVTVTDTDEAPGAPAAPTFADVTISGFTANWIAPANAGPPITRYDLQHRAGSSGPFTDANHTGTATSKSIAGLDPGTRHEVRVRARSDEGVGAWSAPGTVTTVVNRPPRWLDTTVAPLFRENSRFDFDVFENAEICIFFAGDPDAEDDVTFTVGGVDGRLFSIGPARFYPPNGCLIFPHDGGLPDFDDPRDANLDNVYEFSVTATGGSGARARSITVSGTLTILNKDERPVFSGDAAFEVAENIPEVGRVQADDPDEGQTIVAWDLGGPDAGLFGIGADGALAFLAPPDFERPGSAANTNAYRLTVIATSNPASRFFGSASRDYTVTVTDALEPPGRPAAPGVTRSTPTGLDLRWAAPVNTGPPISDYDLRWRVQGSGESGWRHLDDATPSTALTASLAGLATGTAWDVQVRAENAEGPGAWSASAAATTAVNAGPAFAPGIAPRFAVTIPENGRPVFAVTATDPDPGDEVTLGGYALGGPDEALFEIAEIGGAPWLRFRNAPDFEAPRGDGSNTYRVTVTATGGSGPRALTAVAQGTVTVADADEPPVFLGDASLAVTENDRQAGTVMVADPDAGDRVAFTLGGADGGLFDISNAGALAFKTLPDFERPRGMPASAANTSTYALAVTAAGRAGGASATRDYTVTVADADDEAPGAPAAPTFATTGSTVLEVEWQAPANAGPPIADYDVQYREGSSGPFTDAGHAGTGTSIRLEGLAQDRDYEVQVRASNAEGTGAWSQSGAATTVVNRPPMFIFASICLDSSGRFEIEMNEGFIGSDGSFCLEASDPDPVDAVTYALSGPDAHHFTLSQDGRLTSTALNDFENRPSSADGDFVYELTVTATGGIGERALSIEASGTFVLDDVAEPPVFSGDAALTVAENAVQAGTVTVTDPDTDERVFLSVRGPDGALFDITDAGVLSFRRPPDFETPRGGADDDSNTYEVNVRARSLRGTATTDSRQRDYTVTVTDVLEPPAPPSPPSLTVLDDALDVRWEAPANTGPTVDGYDVQHRVAGSAGAFTDSGHAGTATSHRIENLAPGTAYEVRVRARNDEGLSLWSAPATATTAVNRPPDFPASLTSSGRLESPENATAVGSAAAADPDAGDAVTYALSGPDAGLFSISGAGALAFLAPPDFESPLGGAADDSNDYRLTVAATGGTGQRARTATLALVVAVTDENEPPPAPDAPTVGGTMATEIVMNWLAPDTAGRPPVTEYDVLYRARGVERFQDADHDGTATTVTIAGLLPETVYEVRVRARNDEGPGLWSDVATAATTALPNNPPAWTEAFLFVPFFSQELFENRRQAYFPFFAATDPDPGDTVTYALDGPDAHLIQLSSGGSPSYGPFDFENPRDANADNVYEFTVTATSGTGTRELSITVRALVMIQDEEDEPPRFSGPRNFEMPENGTAAGTVTARPTAGGRITGFRIVGGADRNLFEIGNDGALAFKAAPDFENPQGDDGEGGGRNDYALEVEVRGVKAGQPARTNGRIYVVTVTDVDEPPSAPARPEIFEALETALAVRWQAPDDAGRPPPERYDLRYRETGAGGDWLDGPQDVTGTEATVTGLTAGTEHEVQVRAESHEGAGPWSAPAVRATRTNRPPAFSGPDAFIVAENVKRVGAVTAADPDAGEQVTGYTLGGADADLFEIAESGALAFVDAPNFEEPLGGANDDSNTYELTVTATGGDGLRALSAEREYTVTVTDAGDERPHAPARPTFGAKTVSSLEVEWTAPGNPGPPISDYDVQYREAGSGGAFTDANHEGAGTTAALAGLSPGLQYEVQVRARNADGEGPWSRTATARTLVNRPPAFRDDIAPSHGVDAAENATQVLDVTAADPDAGDDVALAGYTLGGADAALFEIAVVSGRPWLVFASAPDFETPGSAANTNAYSVTVTAAGGDGARRLTVSAAVTVTVTDVDEPPAFSGPAAFEVAENTALAGAVAAADPDADDTVRYTLGGTDAGLFRVAGGGALHFLSAPDFETPLGGAADDANVYELTVTATGGGGAASAARDLTVTVTDVDEPPERPAPPTLVRATETTLGLAWQAPRNRGPPIEDHDVEYRTAGPPPGPVLDAGHDGVATTATIENLDPATAYEVRVRAFNVEGGSAWSDWAAAATTTPNRPPAFSGGDELSETVAENVRRVVAAPASDPDPEDEVTYGLGGPDADLFEFRDESGTDTLFFKSAPDFENPADAGGVAGDNVYEVTVEASSGAGGRGRTAAARLRVTVTDADEPPLAPDAPAVARATPVSLDLAWEAPDNAGRPPIARYDLQYRQGRSGDFTAGPQDVTGLRATIAGLTPGTEHEVQVRAENDEGEGAWSAAVLAMTGADALPVFSGPSAFIVPENATRAGPVTAADPDASDRVTGYALGGADGALFELRDESGTNVLHFLAAPDFEAPRGGAADDSNTYEVTVTATGGDGARETSAARDYRVTVTDAPDPPVFPGPAALSAPENQTSAGSAAATDQDAGDRVTGYTLGGPDAGLFTISNDGALSLLTAPDFEAWEAGGSIPWRLTVTATSGADALTASRDFTVTVTDVDEPPEKPAPPTLVRATATSLEFEWRTPPSPSAPVTDYDLGIREAGDPATERGLGHGIRTSKIITGYKRQDDAAETPLISGVAYQLRVRAQNEEGESPYSDWSLPATTVVNEPPVWTLPDIVRSFVRLERPENTSRHGSMVFAATDPDDGDGVTYALSGPDGDLFEIDGDGELRWDPFDFEDLPASASGDTVYEFTVTATGGDGVRALSIAVDGSLTVLDANEPPAFSGPADFSVAENATDAGVVQAADPDAGEQVTGYTLGGADARLFSITNGGALSFNAAPDFESPGSDAGTNVYAVTVTAAGGADGMTAERDYTVTVTDALEPPGRPAAPGAVRTSAAAALVEWRAPPAVPGRPPVTGYDLQYRDARSTGGFADGPQDVTGTSATVAGLTAGVRYQVRVRARNDEGAGAWSDPGTAPASVNTPPAFEARCGVAQDFALEVAEDAAASEFACFAATDPDAGDTVRYRLGGADDGSFEIAADGALRFADAPDFETPGSAAGTNAYELTVTATGGSGARARSVSANGTVTVLDADEPPAFSGPDAFEAPENGTAAGTVQAADPDAGESVTGYALGGADAGLFDMSGTGVITFKAAPDFETPGSAANTNTYRLTVTATSGAGALTAARDYTVTVTDVDEPPVFAGPTALEAPENGTAAGSAAAVPDAGDTVSYTLGGADAGLFGIAADGALSFLNPPDFEAPGSAANTNTYELTVTAAGGAGALTAAQGFTVTVTDVQEAPDRPAAPSLVQATADSLEFRWQAPANTGPPIEDYDVQYREAGAGGDLTDANHAGTGTTATLAGLESDTAYEVQVRAFNGEAESAWSDAAQATTTANAPPAFAGEGLNAEIAENAPWTGRAPATDPDSQDQVTYALGGPDADLFDISGDGEVTFLTPPDFENPRDVGRDNIYVMTVNAASGAGPRRLTATAELRVRVRDAAEPPEFSGPDAFEVAENGTAAGTVQASDPDDGEQVTGYTLGGADADLFGIDADGALSFLVAPDFERPLGGAADDSNIHEVTVTATGGADGMSASRDYRVTVTDVDDEAPGAPAPEVSAVSETGVEVTWAAPANAGPPIEGYEVGYRRGYAGAFTDAGHTGTGTSQRIDDLEPGAAYQVRVQARNAEGTGPWSVPVTAITTANDPPAFAPGTVDPVHAAEVAENVVQVVEVTATDPDDPVTYALSGADANRFEVVESGAARWLAFKAAPDFESPGSAAGTNVYAVTVTATGGAGARAQSVAADVTVTVTDAPEPPAFSGPETFSVAENTTDAGTLQASDPDAGERVTGYTLGGADAVLFGITDAGVLSFADAPDFERPRGVPAGAANTNAYTVTVTATSGADAMTAARDVMVTVTDALEPPGVPAAPVFGAATQWH